MKYLFVLTLVLLPIITWAQGFTFFDDDYNRVKEKKAVYFSGEKLNGKGKEFLILKPAPGSGLDTVLVTFFNGVPIERFDYEWIDAAVYKEMEIPNQGVGSQGIHEDENQSQAEISGEESMGQTIFIRFTVTEKGEVKDIKVLKNRFHALSAEAVRRIKLKSEEGSWKPAIVKGKPVAVNLIMPITLKLNQAEGEE